MSIIQTLQSAQNGTVWSRREGGITYFLRKVNNTYEVWTSLASGSKSTVTLSQAVTFYSQHNLVNSNTAARPEPAAPTRPSPPPRPAPAASPTLRPATTSVPTTTRTPTLPPVTGPATVPEASDNAPAFPPLRTESLTIELPEFDENGNLAGNRQVAVDFPIDPIGPSDEEIDQVFQNIEQEARLRSQIDADRILSPVKARSDWRVRLALSDAPDVNYLYRAPNPGILNPLNATNGVLFPYTPAISVNYAATYNPTELVHSNYKVFQYSSSSIDSINITCDFTAQDEYEANYLLAVIHFFRSATKMFYGQDENPRRGTPPPLCYIYGMGSYQFAGQPLAITQFSYNLPNSVDYIKTSVGEKTTSAGTQTDRMAGTGVARGGVLPPPQFTPIAESGTVSWVPSKIQLSVTCVPMMSRNQVSNVFSFEKYATGALLNGIGKASGGFW
jgi:hypothetical protein